MNEFTQKLVEFEQWAHLQGPQFGDGVSRIIQNTYVSQMGATPAKDTKAQTPAVSVVDKLSQFLTSAGSAYLNTAKAYYETKQKIEDLKLASKGSPATQVVNTTQQAVSKIPTDPLFWGALGLAGLLLLTRR